MPGRLWIVVCGLGTWAASAAAQVPGSPVLQNAFANPGLALAANFATGSGQSFYGGAAAWGFGGPGVGGGGLTSRLQLSGAAGVNRASNSSRGAYGARVAVAVWSSASGALGVGAFAGVGGGPRTRVNGVVTNPALLSIPAGLSVGYRRAVGSRGVSLYASPFYRWTRSDSGVVNSSGTVRVSFGLDVGLSPWLGVTLGGELGGRTLGGSAGAFGAAVSFVTGRR